ncbi:MAG: amidohydrolase family protein, partial [Caldimonas sp.]
LPLLFSAGVMDGRITPQRFVELTATAPARAYGLYPRKGTIAIGADADLVIWNRFSDGEERVIRNQDLHHAVDYTPYEGHRVKGWPAITLSRGEVVWDGVRPQGESGRGRFLECGPPTLGPRRV